MTVSCFSNSEFESLAAGPLPYCKDLESAKLISGGFNIFQRFLCKVDEQAHVGYKVKKEHFVTMCEALCGKPFKEPRAPRGKIQQSRRVTRRQREGKVSSHENFSF